MVRDLFAATIAAVRRSWQALSRCAAVVFPSGPPSNAPYPAVPGLNWSLTSVVKSGSLNPDDPIQATLLDIRQRFIAGSLFSPVAKVASRGVVIVSRITETGAIKAEHILVLIPLDSELNLKNHRTALMASTNSFSLTINGGPVSLCPGSKRP